MIRLIVSGSPYPENAFTIEPVHDKHYIKTCATSEDSDQPVHPYSLSRVFADCMCLLEPLGYLKWDKQESSSYWVGV